MVVYKFLQAKCTKWITSSYFSAILKSRFRRCAVLDLHKTLPTLPYFITKKNTCWFNAGNGWKRAADVPNNKTKSGIYFKVKHILYNKITAVFFNLIWKRVKRFITLLQSIKVIVQGAISNKTLVIICFRWYCFWHCNKFGRMWRAENVTRMAERKEIRLIP